MLRLDKLVACEIAFPQAFSYLTERTYGLLFHNLSNAESHDSNHAVILDTEHADQAVDNILDFYRGLELTPRIYQGFLPDEAEVLWPILRAKGFRVEMREDRFFERRGPCTIPPARSVEIRRMREVTPALADLIRSGEGGDWTAKVLERHLRSENLHLLAAFAGGKPVSMGSLEVFPAAGVARIDNVLTHPNHRRKGYARAIIHDLVERCVRPGSCSQYTYASDPTAIRIYKQAGFVDAGFELPLWTAWVGETPKPDGSEVPEPEITQ